MSIPNLFCDSYRKLFAMRLLDKKLAYQNLELLVLRLLKEQYGAQFTSKMEGMLYDLMKSKDHLEKFQSFVKENEKKCNLNGVEFNVQVLTTGFWPQINNIQLVLPMSMTNCVNSFTEYYQSVTEARKLSFTPALGSCVVEMNINDKTYDLSVTTLQAVVLDLFTTKADGTSPNYSLEEIVAQLSLTADPSLLSIATKVTRLNEELRRRGKLKNLGALKEEFAKKALHSLSCGKLKVLTKTPKNKRINKSDRFTSNTTFSNSKRRLRIPMASVQPSHNSKRIEDDRTVAIEAAIVKIMKTRKQMRYTELEGEVLKQLLKLFSIRSKSFKRCIERLMDREYIERDEHQSDLLHYLA